MAIKHGSKVDKSYSSASMTDLMFLLLLFLLIATTLINPNALKLMLPKSANQLKDKGDHYGFDPAGRQRVQLLCGVGEGQRDRRRGAGLRVRLDGKEDPTVSLHCDKTVAVDEVVKVMNIAKDRNYKLILATQP